jgi:hypothetical protein
MKRAARRPPPLVGYSLDFGVPDWCGDKHKIASRNRIYWRSKLCTLGLNRQLVASPRTPFRAPPQSVYSLLWPTVLPVFGFTKCADPHARQVTPTKTFSARSDSSSSGTKPCTISSWSLG